MINKLKQLRDSRLFADLKKSSDYVIRILNYVILGMILLIGYKACNTEGEIDGSLFTYDKKSGHWEIGHIHSEKKVHIPIVQKDKNMIDIKVDALGIRTYGYKRRLWTPLGMGIWGGVFIQEGVHPRLGQQLNGGISLSISF